MFIINFTNLNSKICKYEKMTDARIGHHHLKIRQSIDYFVYALSPAARILAHFHNSLNIFLPPIHFFASVSGCSHLLNTLYRHHIQSQEKSSFVNN